MEISAIKALEALSIRASEETTRFPLQAIVDDLERADWVIALQETEHRPLLDERFPGWAEEVEYWEVDDGPEALALIEHAVAELTVRLANRENP